MPEAWEVPVALDGERVDRALALITGLSRREVNELLDDERVKLAGATVGVHSRKVRAGQRLEVAGEMPEGGPARPVADPSIDVPIVWCDEHVIVVDKPAGMVVHPGAGNRVGTMVHGLLVHFPELAEVGGARERPGIVHRLDKGTSGLLVVARTQLAHASLVDQLSSRQMYREYVTLVAGLLDSDAGVIDAPLGRSDVDATRIRIQAGGREARTRYEVRARYHHPADSSLLSCRLETGRTHQIRVHLTSIGHPVVGDDRYGVRSLGDWQPLPVGRPFLHAATLEFDHPESNERRSFSSPLPEDLLSVLETIGH